MLHEFVYVFSLSGFFSISSLTHTYFSLSLAQA